MGRRARTTAAEREAPARLAAALDGTATARSRRDGWLPDDPSPADDAGDWDDGDDGNDGNDAGDGNDGRGRAAGWSPGRWAVPWRAAVAAVVLVALVVVVLALRSAGSAPATAVPVRPAAAPVAGPGPVAVSGSAQPSAAVPSGMPAPVAVGSGEGPPVGEVVVHVVGQVAAPGLVRVPAGSRVADAVSAAGGATTGADLSRVNLARIVVDGEQVVLPAPGEVVSPPPGPSVVGGSGSGPGGSGAPAAGPVDLNTADAAALDALPGIGEVLAGRILAWREQNGSFGSVAELGEVQGIGDALLADLEPLVTV